MNYKNNNNKYNDRDEDEDTYSRPQNQYQNRGGYQNDGYQKKQGYGGQQNNFQQKPYNQNGNGYQKQGYNQAPRNKLESGNGNRNGGYNNQQYQNNDRNQGYNQNQGYQQNQNRPQSGYQGQNNYQKQGGYQANNNNRGYNKNEDFGNNGKRFGGQELAQSQSTQDFKKAPKYGGQGAYGYKKEVPAQEAAPVKVSPKTKGNQAFNFYEYEKEKKFNPEAQAAPIKETAKIAPLKKENLIALQVENNEKESQQPSAASESTRLQSSVTSTTPKSSVCIEQSETNTASPRSATSSTNSQNQQVEKVKVVQKTFNFDNKPKPSALCLKKHPQGGRQMNVISNQYKLKLGPEVRVCQYVLDVEPMELWDAHRVQAIIKSKNRELELALGPYVCSGKTIYTLREIDQSLSFKTIFKGQTQYIKIDKTTMCQVGLGDNKSASVDQTQSVQSQLLNIIIKQAFRGTHLKQVGKAPRFFDVQKPLVLKDACLQIWNGFKASAIQSKAGTMLCMDSIFKFMSTQSCLEKIEQMQRSAKNQHHWEQMVKLEYSGQSVIANWGNRRTYIVTDIEFNLSPVTMKFDFQGKEICVAEYFKSHYNMVVRSPKQPLFLIKNQDKNFYLPPEFCLIDGVSDEVKKGRGMRDALAQTRITPQDKIKKIENMAKELFNQKCIKDWGLQLEASPQTMSTNVLCPPKIFKSNQIIHCDEAALRRLPIQHPVNLKKDQWVMIYAQRNESQAQQVYETMKMASRQLGIQIEEPHWIWLENENDQEELDHWLLEYLVDEKTKKFRHPTIALTLLGYEKNYPMYKLIFDKYRIPSQVVTGRNARSFNASKASNIIRQMNSKVRGDLFTMKFPEVIEASRTMLIGIDVCHSGRQSVVGFAASTNKTLSQYYSDYLLVPKGTEIINNKMSALIRKAIGSFEKSHKGLKPTNFIIYRDGVSDAQRDMVLAQELPQLRSVISDLYNQVSEQPEITVVVVNKRITQRFFVQENNGRLANPPSGCIIDRNLIEQDGESKGDGGIFDFYLTPSNTTQGCALPTHFYVAMNNSKFGKIDLEHLTFALCHFYFNWAGPIKVPAPCQYAHKIAEFYTNVGLAKHDKQRQTKGSTASRQQSAQEQCERNVEPLSEKLHFL